MITDTFETLVQYTMHSIVVNMDSKQIMATLLFILLILIGKSGLALHHDAVNPKSQESYVVVNKISKQSQRIASSSILLEETQERLQTKSKYSPGHSDPLLSTLAFFNTYYWLIHYKYKCITSGRLVVVYSQPKYILFHALIIPFSR